MGFLKEELNNSISTKVYACVSIILVDSPLPITCNENDVEYLSSINITIIYIISYHTVYTFQ